MGDCENEMSFGDRQRELTNHPEPDIYYLSPFSGHIKIIKKIIEKLEKDIRELEEKIESMARMAVDTFTPSLPLEDSARSENQKNEPADKLEAATKPVLGKEKEDGQGCNQRTANY